MSEKISLDSSELISLFQPKPQSYEEKSTCFSYCGPADRLLQI